MKFFITTFLLVSSLAMADSEVLSQFGYAGPASTGLCSEEPGLHVKNGYDIALESAKNNAHIDCVTRGYYAVWPVGVRNYGLHGDPSFSYLVCKVEYIYKCF